MIATIPEFPAMRSIPTLPISTLRSGGQLRQQVIRISRLSHTGRVRLHPILIAGLSLALLVA